MEEETRVLITGDHPWKGHTGTFKGESLSLLGKQGIIIELDDPRCQKATVFENQHIRFIDAAIENYKTDPSEYNRGRMDVLADASARLHERYVKA